VAELGPQALLQHPLGLGPVVGQQQQPGGLDGPDGGALLADHLTDLRVLEFRNDLPGALDPVVVGPIQGVPARPAVAVVADLGQPRPHLVRRRADGGGPGSLDVGIGDFVIAGQGPAGLLCGGPQPQESGGRQDDGGGSPHADHRESTDQSVAHGTPQAVMSPHAGLPLEPGLDGGDVALQLWPHPAAQHRRRHP
jgi:hypothetical protein